MRTYRLPVIDGKIRATFAAELDVLSMFPDDEASIRQAQFILQDENARLQKLGAEGFVPSELSQVVMHSIDRSVTRRATSTLVALAMVGLEDIGERMSLRRAAAVVSEYSNSDHGTTFFQRTELGIATSSKALQGNQKSIEGLFRRHRAVAHILAARAAMSDHQKPESGFTGKSQTDLHFLATVLHLQNQLSKARNFEDWNMWWIELEPNAEVAHLPEPWLPKRETIDKLLVSVVKDFGTDGCLS